MVIVVRNFAISLIINGLWIGARRIFTHRFFSVLGRVS